ncbi:MAG: hypothetical protein WKG52_07970 [Variovorax sp.]
MPARIYVLAGVNGAGKSSIGGAACCSAGCRISTPTSPPRACARSTLASLPSGQCAGLGARPAGLARALAEGANFAFETTLGARTLPDMLQQGARNGASACLVRRLASPELHLLRVRERWRRRSRHPRREDPRALRRQPRQPGHAAAAPGQPSRVRQQRAARSESRQSARPVLLLHMAGGRTVSHVPLAEVPEWAKPIFAVALRGATAARAG